MQSITIKIDEGTKIRLDRALAGTRWKKQTLLMGFLLDWLDGKAEPSSRKGLVKGDEGTNKGDAIRVMSPDPTADETGDITNARVPESEHHRAIARLDTTITNAAHQVHAVPKKGK